MIERRLIIEAARFQLGIPWRHQARLPKQGFDCIGIVLWAYQQAGWQPTNPAVTLATNYRRVGGDDTLRQRIEVEAVPIAVGDALPADLLLFQHGGAHFPDHVAMLSEVGEPGRLIHCPVRYGRRVVEHEIEAQWRSILVGCYRVRCFE